MGDTHTSREPLTPAGEAFQHGWWRVRSGEEFDTNLGELFFEGADLGERLWRFAALIVLSASIAGFGLLADSAGVVIGAMLVAPLMTPIQALGAALVQGAPRRIVSSALVIAAGLVGAIATGYLVATIAGGAITPDNLPHEILSRTAAAGNCLKRAEPAFNRSNSSSKRSSKSGSGSDSDAAVPAPGPSPSSAAIGASSAVAGSGKRQRPARSTSTSRLRLPEPPPPARPPIRRAMPPPSHPARPSGPGRAPCPPYRGVAHPRVPDGGATPADPSDAAGFYPMDRGDHVGAAAADRRPREPSMSPDPAMGYAPRPSSESTVSPRQSSQPARRVLRPRAGDRPESTGRSDGRGWCAGSAERQLGPNPPTE